MKCFILASVVSALSLYAQDTSVRTTTSVDVNGNRVNDGAQVEQTRSKTSSETTERIQSINGRMVPIERVDEHVVRDDSSGRVVERVIHRFDPMGNPTEPVKETVEEQKRPDGSSTTTTRYRGDVNGGMQMVEKTTTNIHKSGSTETIDTELQRPGGDGSLTTAQKNETVRVKDGKNYQEESTTYRPDGNGGFGVAIRQTSEHTEQGGQARDNTVEYEPGPDGQLQLHSQTVANTVTRPDGSKDSVVDLFGRNVPGTVDDPNGKLRLYEQQTIEQKPGPGSSTVQTLSVRRPTISDTGTLGPSRQISETICKGNCGNPGQ